MKVIFLDHDGVICLQQQWGSRFKSGNLFDNFDQKAIDVLNEILEKTGAEIVVSSDWRLHCDLMEMGNLYIKRGINKIPINFTKSIFRIPNIPLSSADLRIMEIEDYVKEHSEIESWVAVDDLKMFDLGDHFVHCPRSLEGIKQTGIKEKIIKILNNEN